MSDDEKRKVYDKYGKNGLEALERGQDPASAGFGGGFPGGGGGFSGGGQQFHFQQGGFGGAGFDPFDMFEQMFGDQKGGGGQRGQHFQFNTNGGFPGGGGFGGGPQQRSAPKDLFSKGGAVSKLGSPKFPDKTSKNLWFVVFYDNQSQACAQAQSSVETLAEKQGKNGSFKVGAVDCEKSIVENKFCTKIGVNVKNLPVFAFVIDGKPTFFENDTSGTPSAKKLYEFAMDSMPKDLVHNVNHPNFVTDRLLSVKKPSPNRGVLLLTDKYETSGLYFSLAYKYRSNFVFGESRAKNLAMAKEFGVKKYPLLIALVPSGFGDEKYNSETDILRYSGVMKSSDISKWLDGVTRKLDSASTKRKQNVYDL